jgi:predicted transcriptional regulator
MRQIKIIKVNGYYSEFQENWIDSITAGSKWMDVEEDQLRKLEEAIRWANQNTKSTWKYHIAYNIDQGDFDDIFTSAQEVIDKYEKERARQEKEAANYQAKREATALLRKQKQLAKLKKELEGGN